MLRSLVFLSLLVLAYSCHASQYHYIGHIGNKPIQMDLTINKNTITGYYYYEKVDKLIWLNGNIANNGQITISEMKGDPGHTWRTSGFSGSTFSGSISKSGSFTGKWCTENSTNSFPVNLNPVATYSEISATDNDKTFTASYPVWKNQNNASKNISNLILENIASNRKYQFSPGVEGDILYAEKVSKYQYNVFYYSEKFISFVVNIWTDPGENHPDHITTTLNYLFYNGRWTKVDLDDVTSDLQLTTSDLSTLLVRDLKRQGLIIDDAISKDQLSNFLITSSSCTFIFIPYSFNNSQEYVVELTFAKSPIPKLARQKGK